MYDDTKKLLKPSIKAQKKVKEKIDEQQNMLIKELKESKETADKKQDEVIQQLKENQVELIKSVDVLSEIMSQSGSQSGVKRWLPGLPSDFDPLDIIEEEGKEEVKEEGTDEKKPESPFEKKYNFDQTLKVFPSNEEVTKTMSSLTGKMNSKNPLTKKEKKKDMEGIKLYYEIVKKKRLQKEKVSGGTINQNETPIRYHKKDNMVVW